MRILIRADGGREIGMGHIMRTLSLSKELCKYFEVEYVCKNEENSEGFISEKYAGGVRKILASGFKIKFIRENKVLEDLRKLKSDTDILITDSYDVDDDYFMKTSELFYRNIYIDDMCIHKFKGVDMIINQNINADNLNYDLTGKREFLLGAKYVMLRDEFKDVLPKNIRRKVHDIMITMGGSDPFLTTLKIIHYVKEEDCNFHVVVGSSFDKEYVKKLKAYEKFKNINLYYNANMRALMEKCDICVTAAGSTLYELCSVGVPSLSVIVIENQKKVAEKFDSLKIIKNIGWHNEINRERILDEINNLSNDYAERKNISIKIQSLIDGLGTQRIVERILNII